jgi:hypothetical protein
LKASSANWIDPINRKHLFDHLGTELKFKSLDDFYVLSTEQVKTYGGSGLLHHIYSNSLLKALEDVYQYHSWLPWKFSERVRAGYWNELHHQRKFLNWLGLQLDFDHMDDWYKVTQKQIINNGGSGLLFKYNDSPSKLITSVFHDYPWDESRFTRRNIIFAGHWDSADNRIAFLDRLGKSLGFNHMEDWYGITKKEIKKNGGSSLLEKYGGEPSKLVMSLYQNHCWNSSKFCTNSRITKVPKLL